MIERGKILVIGAGGQLGRELVRTLAAVYGENWVVASDINSENEKYFSYCHFEPLNIFATERMEQIIQKHQIQHIYHLAAILSVDGEVDPHATWQVNLEGLLLVLEAAKKLNIEKVFWPSSIAVFGNQSHLENVSQFSIRDARTVYGIAKSAGELWCQYYFNRYGLDVRCLRYPGLIGHRSMPSGGTTDYAVDIYHHAIKGKSYTCYLEPDMRLPMLYMPDAVNAAIKLMSAPKKNITVRTGYNIQGMSVSPLDIYQSIRRFYVNFDIGFKPDQRQFIAEGWPRSVDDSKAKKDWGHSSKYDLDFMTEDMLNNLEESPRVIPIR